MIRIEWLEGFEAVMQAGSFSGAARSIGYTTSAISQQMAAFERSIGVQLFTRGARSVTPTLAATYLNSRIRELSGMLDQIETEMARVASGRGGHLRIAGFASAGTTLLPHALAEFLRSHPDVDVTYDEGEPLDLIPNVIQVRIDLALAFRYNLIPRAWSAAVRTSSIAIEPLQIIASRNHRLVDGRPRRFEDFAAESWVTTLADTDLCACLHMRAAQAGFAPTVTFHSNNFLAIRGLVSATRALALVPVSIGGMMGADAAVIPLSGPLPYREVVTVSRREEASHLVEDFQRALQDAAAQIDDYQLPSAGR